MLRFILLILVCNFTYPAQAQWNFWAGTLQSTKCSKTRNSCLEHLQNGCNSDGIYSIRPSNPINVFCDQTSSGGGWTLITSAWIPAYVASVNPKILSLGQMIASSAPHSFTSMRLYCKSTARYIDRFRTAPSATTDLGVFAGNAYSGTETRLSGDSDGVPANWSVNGSYTELHFFQPGTRRYIIRTSDIHCADEYSSIGGENNNPRLGQEGRIFIR